MSSKTLRTALLVGGAYDLVVGLAIVLALRFLSQILPIPFPTEPIYARLCGVLLLGLAGFYTTTALTLPNSLPSVIAALGIRTLGGLYLAATPMLHPEAPPFLAMFGVVDLFFAGWLLYGLTVRRA